MSIQDWIGGRRPPAWSNEDYLCAEVDSREAAGLLQVSVSRWRQISGSRRTPDPLIGAGQTTPGRRGATWRLRRVLQYAMTTDRDLPAPLPPFLPHPVGGVRYSSVAGARALRVPQWSPASPPITAWAELYRPSPRQLCGHAQPHVMVLTPTWPTETWGMISELQALVGASLERRDWGDDIANSTRLAIVVTPIGDSAPDRFVPSDLKVFDADRAWLDKAADVHALVPARHSHFGTEQTLIPARDIAASLGAPLPWWPMATATASTCSRWTPGHPVTMTVPADCAGRLEAARWLQHHAESLDAFPTPQAARLAAMALPDGTGYLQSSLNDSDLPEGLEVAAQITWPDPIDAPFSIDPWPLLDALLDGEDAPPHIVHELRQYFGDPAFAGPAQLALDRMPAPWPEAFRDHASQHPMQAPNTERWRILGEFSREGGATEIGPLGSPAVIDSDHVTWMAPTGYRTHGHDVPHTALPRPEDAPYEVLLARDKIADRVRGWVRTLGGTLAPLPAKAQWDVGNHGCAMVLTAALREVDPGTLYDAENSAVDAALDNSRSVAEPDSPILELIRSVGDDPLVLRWDELQSLAVDGS